MKSVKKQMEVVSEQEITNLLWTGGYDSTFRLLQLLYMENREVQPIYIIELSYKSPVHELMSMNEIRNMLERKGIAKNRLRPTIYIDKSTIEIDNKIREAWINIKKQRHIGKQYIWIASLCKQYNLQGVELSVEKRSNEKKASESTAYFLNESRMTSDVKVIFGHFSFPLLKLTKKKMKEIAEQEKWSDIMELTWFCHHPIYHPFKKKGIPCGVCNPCRIAIEEGFGDKIPFVLRFSGKYLKKIYNSSIVNFFR